MLYKMKNKEDVSSAVNPKSKTSFSQSINMMGSTTVNLSGIRSGNKKSDSQRCPDCGGFLARMGYCFSCVACGWGGCS